MLRGETLVSAGASPGQAVGCLRSRVHGHLAAAAVMADALDMAGLLGPRPRPGLRAGMIGEGSCVRFAAELIAAPTDGDYDVTAEFAP